jgi:hypothetical protein
VPIGNHGRRYQITPNCSSSSSCRFSAVTFDASNGRRLGTVVFKWNGSAYTYAGPGSWYRNAGGSSCELPSGDVVSNAYVVHERVSVAPVFADRPAANLRGTKIISGTPTAAGSAAGCEPYSMTFDVVMTSG